MREAGEYDGETRAGKKWGTGSYWYENRDFYHGNWENDKPRGEGIYYFWDPNDGGLPLVYVGNFDYGAFNGTGKLFKYISNREAIWIYQGNWKYGKREGFGK